MPREGVLHRPAEESDIPAGGSCQRVCHISMKNENQLVELVHTTGIFERLVAFMGFEEALIALVTEPEACHEFFAALTDYKIKAAIKMIDAYKPDVYVYFD